MTVWSFDINWTTGIIAVCTVALSLFFSIRHVLISSKKKTVTFLELLRLIFIGAIIFTLLKPELITRIQKKTMPEVIVLYDESASMQTKDNKIPGQDVTSREQWVKDQLNAEFYKPLEAKYKIRLEGFSALGNDKKENHVEGTDIGKALSKQADKQEAIRAVILLSDGDWNLGESPVASAVKLRAADIPVYSVGTGNRDFLPDIDLKNIKAPSFCLLNEKISIPFQIQSRMKRDVRATISLSSRTGTELEKEILIPANTLFHDSFLWSPSQTGEYSLTISVPFQKDETIKDNNKRSFTVSVRTEKLKVLVVDSLPRWEYRYLRNALMRDPGVEVKTVLFHPGMKNGGGKGYLKDFPSTKKELAEYDVVFIGDVGISPEELSKEDTELIEGLVKHQGSGVVFLPGRRGRQLSLLDSPIAKAMPVIPDTARPKGIGAPTPSRLYLTEKGKDHLLTMLADSPAKNGRLWKTLPGFYWNASVLKAKPGSDILAVHSSLRAENGRMPLLVTSEYGNGTALFMGTDSAWRWRKGVEDKYHYRFWGQVVRWMAHKRHISHDSGIRVFYSPESPRANRKIFIHATVHDRSGYPVNDGEVSVSIKNGRHTQKITLSPGQGDWGVYKGSFTPEHSGKYKLITECRKLSRSIETDITVAAESREKTGYPANFDCLKEVSDISGGAFFKSSEIDKLVKELKTLPRKKDIEKRFQLWCSWWWGLIIFLLMGLYWTFRKAMGLI